MKTNAVKQIIYDFLKEKVFEKYSKYFNLMENSRYEIFWGKLKNQSTDKIYISLTDKKITKIDRRYEEYKVDEKYYYKKRKQLLVTVSVYINSSEEFFNVSDNLVVELIEFLETLLSESVETFNYFAARNIVINELEISHIRDMTVMNKQTQEFRKEFDIPFEYEDIQVYVPDIGLELETDIKLKN